uniref:Uncharacterized protein n=1 Tax=Trichogramma kaykai TaxID=54128 RepID=A0ABD2XAF7_9HYME
MRWTSKNRKTDKYFKQSKNAKPSSFASAIEDSFNMMFLSQIITTAAALVMQGYQLIIVRHQNVPYYDSMIV